MPVSAGYGFLGKESPAANTNTIVYTCPDNTTATVMVKHNNRSSSTPDPSTYWIIPTADVNDVENKYLIGYKLPLPQNIWFNYSSIPLGSGQSVVCRSDNGTSSFHVYGAEEQQTGIAGILGSSVLNSSSYTVVYTAPQNTNLLARIFIANTKTTTTTIRLAVIDGTDVSSVTDADHFVYDFPLDPYNTAIAPGSPSNQIFRVAVALGTNQSLIAIDDNDAASIQVFGTFN